MLGTTEVSLGHHTWQTDENRGQQGRFMHKPHAINTLRENAQNGRP